MKTTVLEIDSNKRSRAGWRNLKLGALLLISAEKRLHQSLRGLAHTQGRIVVRLDSPFGAAPVVQAVRPAAVLLDLDLPRNSAWSAGESLLREPDCPPMVLLCARKDQFDMRTAMRAGSLLDKTQSPARLLELVDDVLAMPESTRAERNAMQLVLLRWLNPVGWRVEHKQPPGFWNIHE